jgi:PleD family two-component response regulator
VVEAAASVSPSCVLLDLNLAGLSGFEVLEAFAGDTRVAGTPFVVVTADSRSATQERAAGLGATGFVPKPFNVKDLFNTVQAILDAERADEDDDAAGETTIALISSEAVHARLTVAVDNARHGRSGATFVRWTGTASSPVVITEVARRLETTGRVEVLGATGADELAVLFPDDEAQTAADVLRRVLATGEIDVELSPGRSVTLRVHAGLASGPEHAETGDELYMAADVALAEAVDAGAPVAVAR